MTEYKLKVQAIANQFLSFKGYSMDRIMDNYILIGFKGFNFIFEVFASDENDKPKNPWNGEVHVVSSFEEAQRIILLECLPF